MNVIRCAYLAFLSFCCVYVGANIRVSLSSSWTWFFRNMSGLPASFLFIFARTDMNHPSSLTRSQLLIGNRRCCLSLSLSVCCFSIFGTAGNISCILPHLCFPDLPEPTGTNSRDPCTLLGVLHQAFFNLDGKRAISAGFS